MAPPPSRPAASSRAPLSHLGLMDSYNTRRYEAKTNELVWWRWASPLLPYRRRRLGRREGEPKGGMAPRRRACFTAGATGLRPLRFAAAAATSHAADAPPEGRVGPAARRLPRVRDRKPARREPLRPPPVAARPGAAGVVSGREVFRADSQCRGSPPQDCSRGARPRITLRCCTPCCPAVFHSGGGNPRYALRRERPLS